MLGAEGDLHLLDVGGDAGGGGRVGDRLAQAGKAGGGAVVVQGRVGRGALCRVHDPGRGRGVGLARGQGDDVDALRAQRRGAGGDDEDGVVPWGERRRCRPHG